MCIRPTAPREFLLVFASLAVSPLLLAQPPASPQGPNPGGDAANLLQANYMRLPLAFEKGRNGDQEEYVSRGQGYKLALRGGKAFIGVKSSKGSAAAVSLEFAGGRTPKAVPGDELPGKVNLIYGSDPKQWQLGLPTFGKVAYGDVYPGIDVVYYGNQQQIEFDLLVKPGANPEAIRLKLGGAGKLSIDGSGALDLGETAGGLRVALPQIYQDVNGAKKRVPGRYAIVSRDEVAFRIDPWDHTRPLVIDPSIVYSTLFGGGLGNSAAVSIALDPLGDIVVTGGTFAADFPTLNPAQKSLEATSNLGDVFVSKINKAGTAFVYSTYLGGSTNGVNLSRVAVDSTGAAWVSGYTYSSDLPLVNPVQTTLKSAKGNVYVARLSSTGALTFSTYLGGSGGDLGTGMAVDSLGNGYVSGWTESPDFPTTPGALQRALNGTENAFAAKFSPEGALLYSTLLGSGATYGQAIAVDSLGFAYVTGNTNASTFPGAPAGGAQPKNGGGSNDAFVGKLNPGGTALTYFTYLGGAGIENGTAIAVDSLFNAYIGGTTSSAGLAAALKTSGAYTTLPGGSSGFVAKLNPAGSAFSYFTYLGGNRAEGCCGLVLDASVPPNVYLAGSTDSTNFPTLLPLQSTFPGNSTSLFSSTNSGNSFSPFDSNIPGAVSGASINPAGTSAVVLTESGIYRTVNGGASWTQQGFQAIPAGAAGFIARSPVAPGTTIYASAWAYQPFFQYTAFQSTDDGVTWKAMGALPSYGLGLLADPLTANTVYEFGYSSPYVFKSTDGGLTWNPAATGLPAAYVLSMTSTSDGSLYAGGYLANFSAGLGVYKSTNQGGSWTAVNTGLGTAWSGSYALSASGTTVYFAYGDVYKTTNGGATWTATTGGNIGASSVSVSPTNPSVLYALTNSGAVRESSNGGASWSAPATGLPSTVTHPIVDPSNSAHALVFAPVNEAGYVAKLNSTGSALIWSTYLGGTNPTYAGAVATDGAGNVFVTGSTISGAGFPVTLTDLPWTANTNTNVFLTKISDATAACSTLSVNPGSALAPQNGGTLIFNVVAPSGCAWTASTEGSLWADVTSGSPGNGSGIVTVQTSSNTSGATRTAIFKAGTQTATITQPSKTCAFSLDKSNYTVPTAGGPVTAILTATAGCPWAVTNNYSSAIKITSNPSGTGSATIGLTVTAPNLTDTKPTFSLAVGTTSIQITQGDSPLTITTGSALGTFPIGQDQINLNASGGSGNYTWTVASGSSLPPGLNIGTNPFGPAGQIALVGIATTPGNYSFSLTVNDGNTSVTQPFTLKITPLTVKDINLPDAFIGTAFSYTLTALNSTGTASFKLTSSLPTWLSLSAGGAFSGVPTAAGNYNINFSVSDGVDTTYRGFQLNVYAVDLTTPGAVPNATKGVAYSTTLTASGGSGGYQYALTGGSLPQGLSLSKSGTISGTTNAGTGMYWFYVTVTDSTSHSYQKTMSIDVVGSSGQIQITLGTFTDAVVGNGYSLQVPTCCGGTGPFTWTATGLPAGMSIRYGSGVTSDYVGPGWGEIWGVASTPGTYNVTVTVKDSLGASASLAFPLHVSVLGLTCCGPPNGTIDVPYSTTARILGGSGSYTDKQIDGALPDGLALNTAAAAAGNLTIEGTPLENGFFCPVVFEVTDSLKNTLTVSDCLGINNLPGGININNNSNLGSVNPGNYSFQLSACCVANYTWSIAGGMPPPDLKINSATGLLSGPVTEGTYTFLVKAADAASVAAPGFRQFTLDVTPIAITTNLPGYGNVGTVYTTALTATGGTGALTWSLVYGNYLPPGLKLDTNGTLSGTPTSTGFSYFGITVSDTAGHTATRYYGLTILAAGEILITSGPNLGTWTLGTDQIPLNAAGGAGTYTWSLVSGSLPPGLSLGVLPNNGGQFGIVGVATAANKTPYSFTLSVTDGHTKVSQAFTLKITALTLKDGYNLPSAFVGKAYSYTFTPLNNAGAATFTPNGPLPGTMTLSAGGVLTGTAPAGFYNINFNIFDGTDTVFRGFQLSVYAVDITTPGVLADATPGVAYSQTLTATGGTGGYQFSVNGLPNNLKLNASTGVISGIVSGGAGPFKFQATVTDSSHNSYTKQMMIPISGGGSFLAQLSPYSQNGRWDDAVVGNPYSNGIGICCGGTGPYTWSATGLPVGMSIRSGTGNEPTYFGAGDAEIWGTATVAGNYNVKVTLTDFTGATVTQTFPLRVSVLDLEQYLPNGTLNTPYNFTVHVLGGSPAYSVTQSGGQPPDGLNLNTSALATKLTFAVEGTPVENGGFNMVFHATDGSGNQLQRTNGFQIQNVAGGITINNNANLGQIAVNGNFNFQLSACCVSSYVWSPAGGTMPTGIGLSPSGLLSGKATVPGTYTFLVKAADAASVAAPGYRQFTLTVTPISITTPGLPAGVINTVYSAALAATGGTGTLTWSLATANDLLPPGIMLNANGTFTGTPTVTGQFGFNVTVTDASKNTATRFYSISVYGPAGPPPTTNFGTNLGTLTLGTQQFALGASAGTGTYAWSLVSGSLPPGLALRTDTPSFFSSNQQAGLMGVATTPGTYNFTLKVTSGSQSFTQATSMRITALTTRDDYNLPPGFAGTSYSYTFTALNNAGPVTFTPNSPLPGTMTLSAGGVLSGTAPAGSYNINFNVFDGTDTIGRGYQLNVHAVNITTPAVLPDATPGVAYSQTLTATGGTGGYQFSVNGLPNALKLDASTGVISGMVSGGGGPFQFQATVTDSSHNSYTKRMMIPIAGGVSFLGQIRPYSNNGRWDDAVVGNQYSNGIGICCGGTGPFTWSATGLPAGISIRAGTGNEPTYFNAGDAEIWGTPSVAGNYNVKVTATDHNGATVTQTFPLRVSVLDLEQYLPNGTLNTPYDATVHVLGGSAAYSVKQSGGQLPEGLSLNTSALATHLTFAVQGTPVENGGFNIVFQASDGSGDELQRSNGFQIQNVAGGITINNGPDLGQIALNSTYNFPLSACCVSSYVWSLAGGTMPTGIGLSPSGVLSGKATATGTFTFLVKAADAASVAAPGYRQFTLTVTPISITSPGLPYGIINTVYSAALAATGGTGALTWSLATANDLLPPGIMLNPNGTFTGTPTVTGQFGFNVTVMDAGKNTVTRFFTISVYPPGGPPVSINTNIGTWPVGTIQLELDAGGGLGSGYTWSVTSGALPPGLALRTDLPSFFSPNASAGLIGVATTTGSYNFTLKATSGSQSTSKAFTMTIVSLNLMDPNLRDAFVGAAYSYQFTPVGQKSGSTVTFAPVTNPPYPAGIPSWLTLSASGLLAGTPPSAGNYQVGFNITDGTSTNYYQYTLHVYAVDITTPGQLPNATEGGNYNQSISASGGSGGYTYFVNGGLPNGLSLSGATISGTVTAGPGLYTFGITARDTSSNFYTKQFAIDVVGVPATLPSIGWYIPDDATVGNRQSLSFRTCCGGVAPFTWSASNLPPGLAIRQGSAQSSYDSPGDVEVFGIPQTPGSYLFTLTLTDAAGNSTSNAFPLNVGVLDLGPTSSNGLPNATIGSPYTGTMRVLGGTTTYSAQFIDGEMPGGLSLQAGTLKVSGTPIEDYSCCNNPVFLFGDSASHTLRRSVFLGVNEGTSTIRINPDGYYSHNLGTVQVNSNYQTNFSACCDSPYVWAQAGGTKPPGLTLDSSSGTLSGMVTTVGTYTFLISAANGSNIGYRQFVLTVTPLAITSPGNLPDGNLCCNYSYPLATNGASGSVTWAVTYDTTLPPGLKLNATTGVLSGTPTSAGTYFFTLIATDAGKNTAIQSFSLSIYPTGKSRPVISALSINGTCVLGNCASPGVLAYGGSTEAFYSGTVTLANTDKYQVDWSNSGNNFGGLGGLDPAVQVTYLGNSTNGPSGTDVLTIDFLQGVESALTSFSKTLGISGSILGPVGTGTSASAELLIDGNVFTTFGPFTTTSWSGSSPGSLSGLTDPLFYDVRYKFTFAAGSVAGAQISSGSINLIPQSIVFSALASKAANAAPFSISASASSGLAVSFASGTPAVCRITGTTVTIVGAGTCAITASQAGNAAYAAANPVTQTFTVSLVPQSISFGPLSNQTLSGSAPPELSATATSGLAVKFASNFPKVCTVSGVFITLIAGGACSITASQGGNGVYAPATPVTQVFYVIGPVPVAQTIAFGPLGNLFLGSIPAPLSATATSGLPVSFAPTTATETVCTVSGVTITLLKVGTCSIVASQAGNVAYAAAPTVTQSFTISADVLAYASTENPSATSSTFGKLDLITGAYTQIATISYFLSDMAVAPDGTVYVLASPYSKLSMQDFGTINPTTGAITVIAPITVSLNSMAFRGDGTLFSTNFTGSGPEKLYTVNPSTGAATFVTNLSGTNATDSNQLRFIGNTAYTTDYATPSGLYTINLATGAGTLIGATGLNMLNVLGAVIDGQLVDMASVGAAGQIFLINPATGAATPGAKTSEILVFDAIVQPLFTQTIAFGPLSNVTLGVAPFALSATASSGLAVAFSSTTLSVCTVTGNTVTIHSSGPCTITASRAGNADYSAAAPVTHTFTVSP